MKKTISSITFILSLSVCNPTYAAGIPVIDATHIGSTVAGWIMDGAHAVKEAAEWARVKLHNMFEQNSWIQQGKDMKESIEQVGRIAEEVKSYTNDPVGALMETTALDDTRVKNLQYLPKRYNNQSVNAFKGGEGAADKNINTIANNTYKDIMEDADKSAISIFPLKKNGKYEAELGKHRDAKEAAYYLALAQTAYAQASHRYDELSKSYKEKIESADETREKERLLMELQAEQILLQNQQVQLTAMQQTHEARQEVMRVRKEKLAKVRKEMGVSLL